MRIYKKILLYIIFVFLISAPVFVYASNYGTQATADEAGLKKGVLPDIIGNVIGKGLTLIGVLFFILMIYAGILWMTARGNEEQSKKALNAITAAIVGLIIVIAAYAITVFVFDSLPQST